MQFFLIFSMFIFAGPEAEILQPCEFSQPAKIRNLHCSRIWFLVHCSYFCHFVIYDYYFLLLLFIKKIVSHIY